MLKVACFYFHHSLLVKPLQDKDAMNALAIHLANYVREKMLQSAQGIDGFRKESRSIFNGPPMEILEAVFENLLNRSDSIGLPKDWTDQEITIVLQVPANTLLVKNPGIGVSGYCDDKHLLDLRNSSTSASFVALVPPGQHNNKSVSTTTDEFGLNANNNSAQATFESWWSDDFIQRLLDNGLRVAGVGDGHEIEEARLLVKAAALALDEISQNETPRSAAWRLLSRIYSIPDSESELTISQSISLACGYPSLNAAGLSEKIQSHTLEQISGALADGFKAGVDQIKLNSGNSSEIALLENFLEHIQKCKVPTAFERATSAYYLPSDALEVPIPPKWWTSLTVERWTELLAETPQPNAGLEIECTNAIYPYSKGIVPLVTDGVALRLKSKVENNENPIEVVLERNVGGKNGKSQFNMSIDGAAEFNDDDIPPHKTAIRYKIDADGYTGSGIKVISLARWTPGIFVTCRTALKISPPKPPRKGSRTKAHWETELTLPGAGRYELTVFVSPHAKVGDIATGIRDDSTEVEETAVNYEIRRVKEGEYQIEIDADGKYQIDIPLQRSEPFGTSVDEKCRVQIICEETSEDGCRSEFERLIKINRQQLEQFNAKAVVQLDRNARSSSLQTWLLDEKSVGKSYRPLVVGSDYASVWIPPDWDSVEGPIISAGKFLHDPRPSVEEFVPPAGFINAREKIAKYIRNTDEQSGLVESTPLGQLITRNAEFKALVELYLDSYQTWLKDDPTVACWIDTVLVTPVESDQRTISRIPDAILLSPLHPVRFAWHCVAQQALYEASIAGIPCPAASVLDPDCIPDVLTLALRAPDGIEATTFFSVECNSDYWSVLWNSSRLSQLAEPPRPPFDGGFGITVGGISSGFSAAQVSRALEDISNLLSAKSIINIVISSTGGTTDACNDGLVEWSTNRFGDDTKGINKQSVGPRMLQVFDTRNEGSRPDDATISNLSEDTNNHVRWFSKQPKETTPDLGVIAQLDSSEPEAAANPIRSPLGSGALIRHHVRRQLPGGGRAFLSESRQGWRTPEQSEDILADKVSAAVVRLENLGETRVGLRFAPNVHAIQRMLEELKADFVAVSSAAIDPACFLGQWIKNAYLWDYDLPSYSNRAGDNNGYYLLSQVKRADNEGLTKVLGKLPGCADLSSERAGQILLEVARRGIPTVRGLSGDDTGATGDLGLFLAVRLLQDEFRIGESSNSLLPVVFGTEDDATVSIIVPVDPFRGYLEDLAKSLRKEYKDISLSRPDLLVVGIRFTQGKVYLKLTPVEVKCRQGIRYLDADITDALGQAKALSKLFNALLARSKQSTVWQLAYQHLLLSMVGFGLRVYSQHQDIANNASRWAGYHEKIATAILENSSAIEIDPSGRLIVIDESPFSDAFDKDQDGFKETIVIGSIDAGRIVNGDSVNFYSAVREKVDKWDLVPNPVELPSIEIFQSEEKISPITLQVNLTEVQLQTAPQAIFNPDESSTYEAPTSAIARSAKIEVPEEPDGAGIILSVGKTINGFEPRALELNLSDTKLNNLNIGVVGDLGTGKTQLLKSLIYQITKAKAENRGISPRFLIFDYKKDYSSEDFVKATGAKVIKPYQLPLNLFDVSSIVNSPAPWLDRFRFFADVLDKIYSGIGPVQRDKLKNAVRSAYESCAAQGRPPTIYDVHSEYRTLLGNKSDSPMAIIDDLVDMEIFAKGNDAAIPFSDFLDGVVVVSLDAMGQDDRSKNMLVAIMLNMFYENMLKTPKRPFKGSDPQLRVIDSYLLVDEADNIMRYEFDVLRKLLLQGREFGAGVILASQYLRHFKVNATDYRDPLLTWFIHKVPNVTPTELGALGFTADVAELSDRVKTLPNHHCVYKSAGITGEVIRGNPFYEINKGAN
jgi:DNA phosphorothioation-dependent restriction protein DptH